MNAFFLYIRLQLKKYQKTLPAILLTMLVICLLLGGTAALLQSLGTSRNNTIRIGIAAQEKEPYLDWIMDTIRHTKSTKYTCELIRSDEETATKQLQRGELTAVFIIPKNYIYSLIEGNAEPVIIRYGKGQSGISSFLIQLLGDSAASIMLDTQAGIYAMDDYYLEKQLSGVSSSETLLNLHYLQQVFARETLFTLEESDSVGELQNGAHYFAVVFLLFFLCMGMCVGKLLLPETDAMQAKLSSIGLGTLPQVLARLFALLIIYALLYLIVSLAATTGFICYRSPLPNTAGYTVVEWARLWLRLFPVLLLICSILICIFVWAKEATGGILFLFFAILCGGYLSGYFYPLSFFPDGWREFAGYLPTGCLYQYVATALSGDSLLPSLGRLSGYSVVFVCLTLVGNMRGGVRK